jgi:hypothetical protein
MDQEIILNNIIGLNPTGTMQFEGTYQLNGNNDFLRNSRSASKENLEKTNNNDVICSTVENFENKKIINNINPKYILIIILILLILLILILLYKKNIYILYK